ncbi:MAG: hypothetical protein FD167_3251, partial [bacterium]
MKKAIDYYHELLVKDEYLSSTQQILQEAAENRHLAFGKRPVCSVLRPYFIDQPTYNFVHNAAQLVSTGINLLGQRLMADDE